MPNGPERWQRVVDTYESVIDLDADEREARLAAACAGDDELRREVDSLIAQEARQSPLDNPVWVADNLLVPAPSLEIGAPVGPYIVKGMLGTGGMGEVYRAWDSKLGRSVALKILPETYVRDQERRARFQREARILASLNHSHIGAIHGFEDSGPVHALVLELVEGPTLADRLSTKPLPVEEAIAIALQIVDALDAAHDQGVVHRDLKPANIKIRPDGTVKVLDFGLAKLVEGAGAPEGSRGVERVAQSPTVTSPAMMTGVATILGSAAYMSPEQARGKPVDRRADIWAFGCVVYEMLTGRRAFGGDEIADTLAYVLTREPDWTSLPAGTPSSIRRLLTRCLQKNPRERLRDIADARLELVEASALDGPGIAPPPVAGRRGERVGWIVAAVASLAAIILAALAGARPEPAAAQVYRSQFLPGGVLEHDPAGRLALSPNGRRLAFVGSGPNGRRALWVQPLDGASAQALGGTNEAMYPFWSPDSRFLAFFAEGKLKKIDAAGGPAVTICDAISVGKGTWNREDVILFGSVPNATLVRVRASPGGTPAPATVLDGHAGQQHQFPVFLPDGRRFLYVIRQRGGAPGPDPGVFVGSLDSPGRTRVTDGGSNLGYARGVLFYLRGATLMAQRFDDSRLQLEGDAVPVADNVLLNPGQTGAFSVADSGALVYQQGGLSSSLSWLDRSGKPLETLGEPGHYQNVEITRDGTQIAVSLAPAPGASRDIWVLDSKRGVKDRVTTDPADDHSPIWSFDGRRLLFASNRAGRFDLYQWASETGETQRVFADATDKTPLAWAPDGTIVYTAPGAANRGDLWRLAPTPGAKPKEWMSTPFNEAAAQLSHDGHLMAFVSDEAGGPNVYVALYPSGRGKTRVSPAGGFSPRFRSNSREIFYRRGQPPALAAVSLAVVGNRIDRSEERQLFDLSVADAGLLRFDVSPDGQQFLVNRTNDDNGSPTILVVNWPSLVEAP
jgi:Tol biopolymer transport system component